MSRLSGQSPLALLAESGNRLARGVDTESRPQDRKIKPGGTVFGKAVAAPADRTDQADRVEHPSGSAAAQRAIIAQNPCAPKRSKIGPQASVRRAVAMPMPTVP